ncbi:MAG TPA: hypothetical protein VFX89_10690 [Gammaproteobacteria bacterium]|nr:hypothetical protein [Gammaproteobacteria bacterium]
MSSRKPSLLFAMGSAVLLASCSVMPPVPASSLPYFVEGRAVTVDRSYIEHYACAAGTPLVCQCASRTLGSCQCSC